MKTMFDNNTIDSILSLINKEVVPAVGCTEPMAVALCTAKATEILGRRPEKITVMLSANMLKNAMGVGIPGTGMVGLPIAIALGAIVGKSEYKLEVIRDLTPATLAMGKEYIAEDKIDIRLKDGNVAYDKRTAAGEVAEDGDIALNMRMVYDFAMTTPVEKLAFILKTKEYNMKAAAESAKGNYGHCLGKTMDRPLSHGIFGTSIFSKMISRTALACDARMGGAMIPVMSNSGSGNQGICATNPVAVFADENENTEEELIRALTLSHLTAIYIKQSLGKLSALCGCVVASIGSSCAITYLMGGDYQRICHSVKNMIANLTGMICDGAKPSCSLKICSGVSTALLSALLSMEGKYVSEVEGIIDSDVDKCIHNLTSIGKEAMCATDDMVLKIMTSK